MDTRLLTDWSLWEICAFLETVSLKTREFCRIRTRIGREDMTNVCTMKMNLPLLDVGLNLQMPLEISREAVLASADNIDNQPFVIKATTTIPTCHLQTSKSYICVQ